MFETIVCAVIEKLKGAGINAAARFPAERLDRSCPLVAVSLHSAKLQSAGCGSYIGICQSGGELKELYGSRARLTLELEVYEPATSGHGADGCTKTLDKIISAVTDGCSGLKLRTVECGQTEFDAESGMFLCRCTMELSAYLTREADGDEGGFTDFTLRGELNDAC